MNHTEENILDLLAKKSGTEFSRDELQIINSWRAESPANEALYSSLQFIEGNKESFQNYQLFDEPNAQKGNRNRIYGVIGILLILVLAVFLLNKLQDSSSQNQEMQVAFLDDLTEIHLMDNASFEINENFNKTNRTLTLIGDAYFDVHHNDKLPFIILSNESKIEVLGTSFHVDTHEEGFHVSVYDGLVKISNNKGENIVLSKGESGAIRKNELSKVDDFYTNSTLITKKYSNVQVYEILQELTQAYHFNMNINEEIKDAQCFYNGSFNNASLKEVLDEFSILFGLKYSIVDKEIQVLNITCK